MLLLNEKSESISKQILLISLKLKAFLKMQSKFHTRKFQVFVFSYIMKTL